MRPPMRVSLSVCLCAIVLFSRGFTAQVNWQPTPRPAITAGSASWQLNGEPVFYDGAFYYPAGATVSFNGNAMVRTGVYQGVPIYQDTTLVPFSIVYVPVGGALMRPYERRRDGDLAGTTASRAPSFPVQTPPNPIGGVRSASSYAEVRGTDMRSADVRSAGVPVVDVRAEAPGADVRRADVPSPDVRGAATSGDARSAAPTGALFSPARTPVVESPSPRRAQQTGPVRPWISFDNARWVLDGPAVDRSDARFQPSGTYHGLPVYRSDRPDVIYLSIVADGPLAPFRRER